jgi:hypothetical protein
MHMTCIPDVIERDWVSGATIFGFSIALETVATDTPAAAATWRIVAPRLFINPHPVMVW